jgi:hypothetical protein
MTDLTFQQYRVVFCSFCYTFCHCICNLCSGMGIKLLVMKAFRDSFISILNWFNALWAHSYFHDAVFSLSFAADGKCSKLLVCSYLVFWMNCLRINDGQSVCIIKNMLGLLYLWAHTAQVYDILKQILLFCLFSMNLSSSMR